MPSSLPETLIYRSSGEEDNGHFYSVSGLQQDWQLSRGPVPSGHAVTSTVFFFFFLANNRMYDYLNLRCI